MSAPAAGPLSQHLARIADIVPWFAHNAFVHYLSPRGLEQYSGGGWGTRDVCQGPVELLLALGRVEPIRDLLLRVMSAQNADGDWPQWFMFFERDRDVRAGDSHGDIVFWPVLALAQYLIASGDKGRARRASCRCDGVAARRASARADREARRARHCTRRVRTWRLERRSAAGRSGDARAHVQRLDRNAALSDARDARARTARHRSLGGSNEIRATSGSRAARLPASAGRRRCAHRLRAVRRAAACATCCTRATRPPACATARSR